jgi:iron-sulfur cluster repair protein YtfE (RIC family)
VENALLNRITLLDDTTRPKAPKIEGITPSQRRQGKILSLYHNMHREQLRQVQRVMEGIEAGTVSAAALGSALSDLQMAANFRLFGNLCGQECQMLTFHHSAEDAFLFPHMRESGGEGLQKVIDRLAAEHEIIHHYIAELETGAVAAIQKSDAEAFEKLKETFKTLNRLVQSHFGYEETELEDALGVYGMGM